jgi:hypothetical protein
MLNSGKEKGYWNYEIINKKVKAKTPLPKAPPPPVAMPTNEVLMQPLFYLPTHSPCT